MTTIPEKILYTAHATATGGRNGTARTSDGALDVQNFQVTLTVARPAKALRFQDAQDVRSLAVVLAVPGQLDRT